MTGRDIAIIGMACVFPKAPDVATYWRNIREGVDAITDVPAHRWDPRYYDPASTAPDRFYARRGGFIDEHANFDAAAFGIMPVAAQGAEPDQLLALQAAVAAIADAGYAERAFARDRTSVILGRGNYLGVGMMRLVNITRVAEQLVSSLRTLVPDLSETELAEVKREYQAKCGVYGADTAIGLVPNLTASRIANRLDLGGSAYTIDAACASALVAVDQACRELRAGDADVAIAGGIHVCQDVVFWSVFSQLGALSRSQQIRPFDRRADGLLIGEGIGVVVLKRLADARRDGDRIYAIVRGTGVASDGRDVSLMTPRVEGQALALTRAWKAAGLEPATAGLVEAHGTATLAGDTAELATLARIFGPLPAGGERIPLGSVKSMIGHTMPAAGAAGLIKAVLAVYHGVRPPTLHCEEPSPALAGTRFQTPAVAEPWEAPLRRAAVNAFGFGGINAHVIVDNADDASGEPRRVQVAGVRREEEFAADVAATARKPSRFARVRASDGGARGIAPGAHPPSFVCAAATQQELAAALAAGRHGGQGPWRLAVLDATPKRLATAQAVVAAGRARGGRDGIHVSSNGLVAQGGRIAFLFPGVEAEAAPPVDDIARAFGLVPPRVDAAGLAFQGATVIAVNEFAAHVARAMKLEPDVIAGHSIGEWSGMLEAGMFEHASVAEFFAALHPEMLKVADVSYVAVGAGAQRVQALVADLPDVAISHDNCVHQSILCGPEARMEEVARRLRAERLLFEVLPFRSGFHSPALATHIDYYVRQLEGLRLARPRLPLWSATTCAPYPDDAGAISTLFGRHLSEPVRFRELVLALYADGARVFVQVGSGSLAAFVDDVLAGKPHLAVPLLAPRRAGMDQLRRAAAALYVEGAAIDLARVGLAPHEGDATAATANAPTAIRTSRAVPIELGLPLIALDPRPRARREGSLHDVADTATPLVRAFDATLRDIVSAQEAVLQALADTVPVARAAAAPIATARSATSASPPPTAAAASATPAGSAALSATIGADPDERTERLGISTDLYPELLDHCLIPQPRHWTVLADRMPVVPLTMSVALMMDAAQRRDPARIAVTVEKVAAHRWLRADQPVEVVVRTRWISSDQVRVSIDGYIESIVTLADRYPEPPAVPLPSIGAERPYPIADDALYRDGWMFHGPGYHGIVSVAALGENGLRGTLRPLPARGALLDAAGQLLGLWASATTDRDRLVLPVRVGKLEYFGPPPGPDERIVCTVIPRAVRRHEVHVDLDLRIGDRRYAYVRDWIDWRFNTSGRLFDMMRQPGLRLLAEPEPGGFVVVREAGWPVSTRDFLMRRYLSMDEVEAHGGAKHVQEDGEWLLGRIVAKDAVRQLLLASGTPSLFPVEITVANDASGRPRVRGPFARDVRVSIAHKPGIAVALAAEGADPGIDIEEIAPRSDGFAALAFGADELALLPVTDRAEWLTRCWAAKEAVGKARGTGLAGNPKGLAVTAISADRILVDGVAVATRRLGDHVVAWTVR